MTRSRSDLLYTDLPKHLHEKAKACEDYRATIIEICEAMLMIMQGNPHILPGVNSTQYCEYPLGQSPGELLDKSMNSASQFWYEEKLITDCRTQGKLMAIKQREFQNRARRQLHHIRTFINNTSFDYEDLKCSLVNAKEGLDNATEELKKGETRGRKNHLKKASDIYNNVQAKFEVYATNTLADVKVLHLKEIEAFVLELQAYHDWLASYCRTLGAHKIRRPAT